MQLPDFLFCENKSALPGAGLILYTQTPFWIGQVIKCASRQDLENAILKNQPFAWAKPHDYNILILAFGALRSYTLTGTQHQANDLATVFRRMADFYLTEKITPNKKYYERYLEK